MTQRSTIFAVSSGSGRAGITVIRISGPAAGLVFAHFGTGQPPARRAVVRTLIAANAEILDQAMVLWLPGPGSATGEDLAEFHVHGSSAIVSAVLRRLAELESFEVAQPGEFTRRAFLNDKLDLLQVEGLADVVSADTEAQRRLAMRQFLGDASSTYEAWRGQVLKALALVEAAIDFSDERDVAEQAVAKANVVLRDLCDTFERALSTADQVSAVRQGLRIVLAGPPNAGKSSLLNWLAGRDAAIVSARAGTTRDVIEAVMVLEGVPVLLSDTAGLRDDSEDEIEREGIRRSRGVAVSADVLVWIEAADDRRVLDMPRAPDFRVVNKIDLHPVTEAEAGVWPLSVKTGQGLRDFRLALEDLIRERNQFPADAVVVRERHRYALQQALTLLKSAMGGRLTGLEFVAEDVRKAAAALAGVTGRIDVEDLLGKIFQDFCIGK
jgi:tRNA modification GTPase